jgi:hypothetical protein
MRFCFNCILGYQGSIACPLCGNTGADESSKTDQNRNFTRAEMCEGKLLEITHRRPTVRGDCECGPRPCPWVGCRYHLLTEITKAGSLRKHFPADMTHAWPLTCALDLSRDGMTLEDIGEVLNITRERVRQIKEIALGKLEASDE